MGLHGDLGLRGLSPGFGSLGFNSWGTEVQLSGFGGLGFGGLWFGGLGFGGSGFGVLGELKG